MKCKHCKSKYVEHGAVGLGCPITDVDGKRHGFSKTHFFEPVEAAELVEA